MVFNYKDLIENHILKHTSANGYSLLLTIVGNEYDINISRDIYIEQNAWDMAMNIDYYKYPWLNVLLFNKYINVNIKKRKKKSK